MELNVEVKEINDNDLDLLFGANLKSTDDVLGSTKKSQEVNHSLEPPNLVDVFFNDEESLEEQKVDDELEQLKIVKDKLSKKIEDLVLDDSLFGDNKEQTSSILKNVVDYYISEGIWEDFEGKDEIEYNNENFQKLLVAQENNRVQAMFNELVDSTGDYGKAILSHIKSGGNLDEIIDLFKLQKERESLDINDLENQEKLIWQYYKEEDLNWSDTKIKKYIDNLKLDQELESEAKEIKEKYNRLDSKKLDKINEQQLIEEENKKERLVQYKNNVITSLKEKKDLTDKDKATIADFMLNYDQKLNDGQMVNKFYLKFANIQNNLDEFIDLVDFVIDKDKYLKRIQKKVETNVSKKTFEFIKGSSSLSNKNSGFQLGKLSKDDEFTNLFNYILK